MPANAGEKAEDKLGRRRGGVKPRTAARVPFRKARPPRARPTPPGSPRPTRAARSPSGDGTTCAAAWRADACARSFATRGPRHPRCRPVLGARRADRTAAARGPLVLSAEADRRERADLGFPPGLDERPRLLEQ